MIRDSWKSTIVMAVIGTELGFFHVTELQFWTLILTVVVFGLMCEYEQRAKITRQK